MRPKTIVLFLIAVGCGLIASIGVSQYMQQASGSGGSAVETAKIFVAVSDINIGEKLDAQNVKLEEWPRDRIPEGALQNLEELEERYPRTRMYAGEPILAAKLMDGKDRGSKALTIPKGYRVVAVKVTMDSAVAGLVQPGDRVDLLVFLRKSSEIPETGTRTILRDVNIFSVDGDTERTHDEDTGQVRQVRTVSLLVKPEQAESVMLASELGRLSLTLRRPDDTVEQGSTGETVHSLLGRALEGTEDRGDSLLDAPEVSSGNEGFLEWLATQSAQPGPTMPAATAAQPLDIPADPVLVEEEPAWTMQVFTSTGVREFRWRDLSDLPEEVMQAPPASSAPNSSSTTTTAQPVSTPAVSDPTPLPPLDGTTWIGDGDEEETVEDGP